MSCPIKSDEAWKKMVLLLGEVNAYKAFKGNEDKTPSLEEVDDLIRNFQDTNLNFEGSVSPGLTPLEDHYAIRSMSKMVFDTIISEPTLSDNERVEKVKNNINDIISYKKDLIDYYKEEGDIKNAGIEQTFTGNLSKLLKEDTFKSLKDKVLIEVSRQTEAIDFEEDVVEEKNKVTKGENYGKESILIDNKKKISRHLKGFLSYIEDVKFAKDGKTLESKRNSFDLDMYIPFDSTYNSLSYHLADLSFDEMSDKLSKVGKYNPVFKRISEEVDKLSKDSNLDKKLIYNEFMRSFHKQHTRFITAKYTPGTSDSRIFYSNRNAAEHIVISQWQERFKSSASTRGNILTYDDGGVIVPRTDRIKNIIDTFRKKEGAITGTKEEKETQLVTLYAETLGKFGINIDKSAVDVMFNNPELINSKDFKLKDFFGAADYIIKSFGKLKSGVSIEEQNPYSGGITNTGEREERKSEGESKNFKLMAAITLASSNVFFATNFLNEELNNIYAISHNSFMSTTFRKLTGQDTSYLDKLLTDSVYHSDSYLLNKLKTDPEFKKNFEIVLFSAFNTDKRGSRGKPFQNLVEAERWFNKLIAFKNSGNKSKGYFQTPTYGDRKIVPYVGMSKLTGEIRNGEVIGQVADAMYRVFLSEKRRIDQCKTQIEKFKNNPERLLEGYHTKGKNGLKFHLLPSFNEFTINGIPVANIENFEGYKEHIKAELNKYMIERVKEDSATLRRLNLYGDQYSEKGVIAEKFFDNFLLNYMVAYAGISQVFSNDIAQTGGFIKASKRNVGINSAGSDPVTSKGEPGFSSLVLKDVMFPLRRIEALEKALNKEFEERGKNAGIEISKTKTQDIIKDFLDIKTTDSQAYTSVKFYKQLADKLGLLTPKLSKILDSAEKGEKISLAEFLDVAKPIKPVFVADVWDEDLEMFVRRFYKFSAFPLFKQLTQTIEEYNDLEEFRNNMEGNGVDVAFYESASKIANNNIQDFYDKEYKVSKIESNNVKTLPWDGMFLQQDNPYDEEDDAITGSAQGRKVIVGDLKDPQLGDVSFKYPNKEYDKSDKGESAEDINKFLNDLLTANLKESYEKLLTEFGIKEYTGKEDKRYELTDLNALNKVLRKEAAQRGYSPLSISALQVITDEITGEQKFAVPLPFTPNSVQFESMLNSLISNRLKQTAKGKSYVQGSSNGFATTLDKLPTQISKNIEWVGENKAIASKVAEEKSGLEYLRVDTKTGKVLPMQLLIPNAYRKYVEDGKLNADFARIVGFRIPLQAFNSFMFAEVVGYLPAEAGNLAIVPYEFIAQSGSDFDFDKLFAYMRNGEVNKETDKYEPIKYDYSKSPEENTREQRENALLDLHLAIFEHPLSLSRMMSVDTQQPFIKENEKIDKELGLTEKQYHPLSIGEQDVLYNANNAGKTGRATASLHGSYHPITQYTNIATKVLNSKGNKHVGGVKFYTEAGKEVQRLFQTETERKKADWAGAFELNKVRGYNGQLISNVLGWLQSVTLDNASDQQLGKTGLDDNTLNAAMYVARAGFDVDIITRFFRQPIIKEFSTMLSNKRAFFASYNRELEDNTFRELVSLKINELRKLGGFTEETLQSISAFRPSDFLGMSIQDLMFNLKTEQKILDKTVTDTEKKKFYKDQIEILNGFLIYKKTADELMSVMSATNADVKGIGKNYHAVINRQVGLQNISNLNYIENGDDLLHDTFLGAVVKYGVNTATDIFTDTGILFYKTPLFDTIFNIAKANRVFEDADRISESRFNELRRDFTVFMSTDNMNGVFNNLFGDYSTTNLSDLRQHLLFGENSLANRISRQKQLINEGKTIEGEWLLKMLNIDIKGSKINPDSIAYNSSNIEKSEAPMAENSITELLLSTNEESRKLGRDIIAYIYMTGGTVASVKGLSSIIPVSYLHKIGFAKYYNNNLAELTKNSIFADRFFDQFMRNNPNFIKSLPINSIKFLGSASNISMEAKGNPKYIKTRNENIEYLYKLDFTKDSVSYYNRITPLGYGNMSEYDMNSDISKSSIESNNFKQVINLSDSIGERDYFEDREEFDTSDVSTFEKSITPEETNKEEVKPENMGKQLELFTPEAKDVVKDYQSMTSEESWKEYGESLSKKYGEEIKDFWEEFSQEERTYKIKCI